MEEDLIFTGTLYSGDNFIGLTSGPISALTITSSDFMFNHAPRYKFNIERVIFNEPATIVFWGNGDKTVVKAQDDEPFDKEKGLAMAIIKYMSGNKGSYNDLFREHCI